MMIARANGSIVLSTTVFREISGVLCRPKFARALTHDRRAEILELLVAGALWVEPTGKVEDCRDVKDNCYLELAFAAEACAIISGDRDLLILDPWRGLRIFTPSTFVEASGT
jgi:putative PIN family toxin of toxin-antitoxin system